jgi:hypothetical protein
MDFQLLPDMGRMNEQWPPIAKSLAASAPSGVQTCSQLFGSVVGTAARRGIDAYQAIRMTLQGQSVLAPG